MSTQVHFELGDHMANDDSTTSPQHRLVARKKIVQVVEEVFDDCGDDVSSILLPQSDPESHAVTVAFGYEASASSIPGCEDRWQDCFDSDFQLHYLLGSSNEAESCTASTHKFSDMVQFVGFLVGHKHLASPQVVEICGGAAGVLKLSARYHLSTGKNFDLTTGCDLLLASNQKLLLQYLTDCKPAVIICAPPCTAFGGWASYNRWKHPLSHAIQLHKGMVLAQLVAACCKIQLDGARHFLVENPQTSRLWFTACFVNLQRRGVHWATLDQCMTGLCDPLGKLTRKSTCFMASSPVLVRHLHIRCDNSHKHQVLEGAVQGIPRCRYAQTWTTKLCRLIILGICELLDSRKKFMFPAVEAPCPACRNHSYKENPRHNRVAGNCRFPDVEAIVYSCAACVQDKMSNHPAHTRIVGECHWAAALSRNTSVKAAAPRVPRVPVAPAQEAQPDADPGAPAPTTIGPWQAVTDVGIIQSLNKLSSVDGWHSGLDAVWLVGHRQRYVRGPEPRYDAKKWTSRATFGRFLENTHTLQAHGGNLRTNNLQWQIARLISAMLLNASFTGLWWTHQLKKNRKNLRLKQQSLMFHHHHQQQCLWHPFKINSRRSQLTSMPLKNNQKQQHRQHR